MRGFHGLADERTRRMAGIAREKARPEWGGRNPMKPRAGCRRPGNTGSGFVWRITLLNRRHVILKRSLNAVPGHLMANQLGGYPLPLMQRRLSADSLLCRNGSRSECSTHLSMASGLRPAEFCWTRVQQRYGI